MNCVHERGRNWELGSAVLEATAHSNQYLSGSSCLAVPTLPSLIRVGTVGEFPSFFCFWSAAHFLHAFQVALSLQPLTTSIFMAVIAATANATVQYNCWHHGWVFIILLVMLQNNHSWDVWSICGTLLHASKWPHPCNRWQLVSFWQWLPPLPTLPSLIIVGTTGEFSSFF